jgi:hypothetical protein
MTELKQCLTKFFEKYQCSNITIKFPNQKFENQELRIIKIEEAQNYINYAEECFSYLTKDELEILKHVYINKKKPDELNYSPAAYYRKLKIVSEKFFKIINQ